MSRYTIHLFSANVFGVITWAENTTSILGAVGALIGVVSGVLLLPTAWDSFRKSSCGKWIAARINGGRE